MFKRIAKVVGFVLLGFVLLIGGVVGFMALRGDFKKKVVKPTAIKFDITGTELVYDVGAENTESLNEQIFSFTISAEPLDVTETECTIKLSNSTLITFLEHKNGEWVEYNSSKFHVNTKIYFKLNNITEQNENDYYDGILTITVKDASGLLQTTLDLEIDRSITSISFKDQSNSENNLISNGLFGYEEQDKYDMLTIQNLEAVVNQDYPLEVITAPLKASKPFVARDEKLYEIYYIQQEQPKLLTHQGELVMLHTYNDAGNIVKEECEFLRYDTATNNYVFNSASSGMYEFKLATYPTYDVQDEILSDETVSFVERLNLGKMVTKSVIINVTGTEAEKIEFNNDNSSIRIQLLKENKWVVNNNEMLDVQNLGLELSKDSGTLILGRYNELKFLTEDNFINELTWVFKQAIVENDEIKRDDKGNVKYAADDIEINFFNDGTGNKKAIISNLDDANIPNDVEYDVSIAGPINNIKYILTLSYTAKDDEDKYTTTEIMFNLKADDLAGKVLNIEKDETTGLVEIAIQQSSDGGQEYSNTVYVDLKVGSCFVLGDYNEEVSSYDFKTLQSGLYLAMIGKSSEISPYSLINSKFKTSILYNGADSIITITPIDGDLTKYEYNMLYAIVVNNNGSYYYTNQGCSLAIDEKDTKINVNNESLKLPIIVGDEIDYTSRFDVDDLVRVTQAGSYNEILMFAPKYSKLTQTTAPTEWGKSLIVYTKDGQVYTKVESVGAYEANKYYVKNNYKTIDLISIVENEVEYFLLGYLENGRFVNEVVPTGINYYSKLYPVVIKSQYLVNEGRVETAEELVNNLLLNKYGSSRCIINGVDAEVTYDLSLLNGRHIYKNSQYYISVTGGYDALKKYYIYDGVGEYVEIEITQQIIDNWESEKSNYYETINYVLAKDVLGDVSAEDMSNLNENLVYYTLEGDVFTRIGTQTEGFIDNWSNYYIVVSHYLIKSTEQDDTNIIITANAVSKGIELTNIPQQFIFSVADYNLAKNGEDGKDNKFKVEYAKIYTDNVITATSYYDFSNSQIVPTVGMGGDYFDSEQSILPNGYQIIAGHKQIELGWNELADEPINAKTVRTELSINSDYDVEILKDIVDKLSVRAIEYDRNNIAIGVLGETIVKFGAEGIKFDFVQAGIKYIENSRYYLKNGESYEALTIVQGEALQPWEFTSEAWDEIVDNWDENYKGYYQAKLYADFEVIDIVEENHYIRFEWVYDNGVTPYKIYSSKLTTISREVTGYTIDIDNTLYRAGLITDENAPSEYYANIDDEFVLVDESNKELYPYQPGQYYSLFTEEFTGLICYQLEVGYNNGYTYDVYAIDENGSYLYYKDGEEGSEVLKIVKGSADSVAFNLKTDGGWINPRPFYAYNPSFVIQGNDYVEFEDNKIVFAQTTDNFTNVVLKSIDGTIQYSINVKVVQDGEFACVTTNIASSDSTKEYKLPANMYTHSSNAIDKELKINIVSFTVTRVGQNISAQYELKNNQIVDKQNNANMLAELKFDGNNWVITRSLFDNITIKLNIQSLLGAEIKDFAFVSPYDVNSSSTNKTIIIYSGTQYMLAKNPVEELENLDTLYSLSTNSSDGQFVIKYQYGGNVEEIDAQGHKFIFTVPNVNKATNFVFTIYYKYGTNEEVIGDFSLTVSPNILITADVTNIIDLDDVNAIEYNFANLGLSRYNISKDHYTSYVTDDLVEINDLSEITYHYETFVDENLNTKYTTNIVEVIDNRLLVVAPISETGTYYANVKVISGEVVVGEVRFRVNSKSKVVSDVNTEVKPVEIIANTEITYTLAELQNMYKLQRGGEVYYSVNNYVEGITYKKIGSAYVKMTTDEGAGYYQKLDLTDMLWITTNNDKIEIKYNYNSITLTQTIEYLYNEYNGEWESGKAYYYIDNSSYMLASEKLDGQVYYVRDVVQKITYNNQTYRMIGTQYNMGEYQFDMFNNQFVDGQNNIIQVANYGKNIAYGVKNGESIIYCKQNAYLFVDIEDANNILALSIEDDGKAIYNFTEIPSYEKITTDTYGGYYYREDAITGQYILVTNKNEYYYEANKYYELIYKQTNLGSIETLTLKYNGFGVNMVTDAEYVDNIEYNIETVFNNNNIKTDDIYTIYVLPYTIQPSTSVLLNDTDYVLYDSGDVSNKGLFNIEANTHKDNIEDISFGSSEYYTVNISNYELNGVQTKYSIRFNANGNNYEGYIPITLTYNNGSTFKYNAKVIIVNKTVVNIRYPYNVEDSTLATYNVFNASIKELVRDIDSVNYDLTDLGKWLGYDVDNENWQNEAYIKYDLALKGDTINLAEDELLNINRYKAYQFEHITTEDYVQNTYYEYNSNTHQFELVTDETEPSDWRSLHYYKKIEKIQSNISKIELVAVSSTYAETLQNVIDSLALNGNTIAISQSLNYTGYVAFKLYESDTTAYGYYILKIVDDEQFEDVIGFAQARRTQTIASNINQDIKIIDLIRNSGYDIATVADIGSELLETDSSNVYLFMVDSYNNGDYGEAKFKDNKTIENGQLIENSQLLTSDANTQTIVIAVVIQSGTSLVHVCNYKLVLQPDVKVTPNMYNAETNPNGVIESVEDEAYHIYRAKELSFDYDDSNKNSINLKELFTVSGTQGESLTSIAFDDNKDFDDLLTFDGLEAKIQNKLIVTIDGTNLVLKAPISEQVYFYLELTYTSGFKVYVRITLNPFKFNDTNQFVVGNWEDSTFNNELDLSEVFGNYKGGYTSQYSTNGTTWVYNLNGISKDDNVLTFTPRNEEFKIYLRLTLNSVVPSISKEVIITVKPNIIAEYNSSNVGTSPTETRITIDKATQKETLTLIGSQLYVDINNTEIKVQNASKSQTYLTINVGELSSVEFNLTTDSGENLIIDEDELQGDNNIYHYFVDNNALASSVSLKESSNLSFVHSALAVNLRLNIRIKTTNGAYSYSYSLYITIPKTYTLTPNYRVDGAIYESVVNNEQLLLKVDKLKQDIDTNFFGTDTNARGVVFGSRIIINIEGVQTQYYGYQNIIGLGLLTEYNPNKLNFKLTAPEGTNVSSIDNGVLTFRSDNNAPTVVLGLSNATTNIEYKFLVLTEDTDYNQVKYNPNLLQVDTNDDLVVDYISINHSQLNDNFVLGYLKYLPSTEIVGQVAWANTDNENLTFKFVSDNTIAGFSSKIVIDLNNLATDVTQVIEVKIITMNGVASIITLVVSNFEVAYGYSAVNKSYEEAYAGTEIGKLTDKDINGNTRVSATVNGNNIFNLNSGYTWTYIGAVRGITTHLPLGQEITYKADNKTLIWYDNNKGILSRSVANNTDVTMIFDVKDSGSNVIGRIYYSLMLQNDIKIGLNPKLETNNAVPLYLGSNIYNRESDVTTIIDLMQSEDNNNYNNLFVTLEQYSTGNVIYDGETYVGKALYNGTDSTTQETQSVLAPSNVAQYLRFEVSNLSSGLMNGDTPRVTVDVNGKLKITGNPSGSFTLSIFSTNGTGYGESFTISVRQYDNTTAQYGSKINIGSGVGFASGTTVNLFNANPDITNTSDYAFNSYRLGYGLDKNINTSILDSDASVFYQVAVFDYGTSVTDIKASDVWKSEESLKVKLTSGDNGNTINKTYSYVLPSVKYSPSTDSNEYQIVSIRLIVTYKGQEQYYFAHYQVYNDASISTNKYYIDNSKTITYADGNGAWVNGTTITIMDIANTGMYSAVTPIVLTNQPSDWGTKYFKQELNEGVFNGKYANITINEKFTAGTYYVLNDIASAGDDINNKYEAIIKLPDGDEEQITDLAFNNNKLTGILPNDLFTNQTYFTFMLKSKEGGAILLEDNWTIKANSTIEVKDSKPLRDFFLRSEIGNQDYYNVDIIGIGTEYNNFVTGASGNTSSDIEDIKLPNGYKLKEVTYTGSNSNNSVFKIEATYYVLVGHNNAISFNFNGGDYYINLTIDDNEIDDNGNATIDLSSFVNVWKYEDGKFVVDKQAIYIEDNSSLVEPKVSLLDVNKLTSNYSTPVIIVSGDTTRTIELYFNIIINAKSLDENGYMIDYGTSQNVTNVKQSLANEMIDRIKLLSSDVESNITLKQELLNLITFNSQAVNTNPNSNEYNYYEISIEKTDCYIITYVYNNGVSTYTRTLKMALN